MKHLVRFIAVAIIFIIVNGGAFLSIACAGDVATESQSEQYSDDTSEELFNELQIYIGARIEKVANKYERLPSFVKGLFENEVYLITIDMGDGKTLKIKAVKNGVLLIEFIRINDHSDVNPSITIHANENTVRMLMNCGSDRQSFEEGIKALVDGTVKVEFIGDNKYIIYIKDCLFWFIVDEIHESIND
ncbi:MAG: hypothetical protein P1P69_07450 [Methanosarcinaceae archaeon]|nr:hypothetical protein [Methanosarcinaceae archaeon]